MGKTSSIIFRDLRDFAIMSTGYQCKYINKKCNPSTNSCKMEYEGFKS